MPVFLNEKQLRNRPLYIHIPHYTHATSPYSSIIDGNYKLFRYYNDAEGTYALFNLKKDISEKRDLSEQHPEIVKELEGKLTLLLEDANAEYPIPVNSKKGTALIEKFYKGETLGFSTKGVNGWRIRTKKSERDYADMERECFEKMIQGDSATLIHYTKRFEKCDIDRKRWEAYIK